jgi:hypothetical protein
MSDTDELDGEKKLVPLSLDIKFVPPPQLLEVPLTAP